MEFYDSVYGLSITHWIIGINMAYFILMLTLKLSSARFLRVSWSFLLGLFCAFSVSALKTASFSSPLTPLRLSPIAQSPGENHERKEHITTTTTGIVATTA